MHSFSRKQDVFVGFATVPGFVSFTSSEGSPYLQVTLQESLCLLSSSLQALATELAEHHKTTDLSDIHLLVKRKLAGMRIGDDGVRQGAEERSSLLSKLLFARYKGKKKTNINEAAKSALSFFSLPSSRSSSPMPSKRNKIFNNQEKPRPMSAVISAQPIQAQSNEPKAQEEREPQTPNTSTSLSRSMSSPSASFSPSKSAFVSASLPLQKTSNILHVVEVKSSDVEGGLNELLDKVKEVYGGEGKVKVKKRNKNQLYSFKYGGPEKAAQLLEGAIRNVRELQSKSELWKFTQRLEVTPVESKRK